MRSGREPENPGGQPSFHAGRVGKPGAAATHLASPGAGISHLSTGRALSRPGTACASACGMTPSDERRTAAELSQEMIDEGMARAEKVACSPGDHCCLPLPNRLEDARASCTPKGRCMIGWIVDDSGRTAWDVWLDVHTGEGRLRRRNQ